MTSHESWRRQLLSPAFALALGTLAVAPLAAVAQGPGTENGLWTYLGGDAWHTRYTPADEITAQNFDELTLLWQFNASSFGPSTPRATPTYTGDKLITVTGERRHVIALDPHTGELLWSFTEPNTHRYEYSMRKGYGKGVAYANVPGRGEVPVLPNMWFSTELQVTTPVPEWNGQRVRMALEEEAEVRPDGVMQWTLRRQTELHLVR